MNFPRLFFVLFLILASHGIAAEPKVKVYVRFFELSGKAALAKYPSLRSGRMTDVLRMQPFMIESGKSAEVSVERDCGGAGTPKNMPNVGVWLQIRPTVRGERILVSVDSKRVDYIGPQAGRRPVFEIGRRTDMRGSGKYGESVQFDLGIREHNWLRKDDGFRHEKVVSVRRRLIAVLIFTRP